MKASRARALRLFGLAVALGAPACAWEPEPEEGQEEVAEEAQNGMWLAASGQEGETYSAWLRRGDELIPVEVELVDDMIIYEGDVLLDPSSVLIEDGSGTERGVAQQYAIKLRAARKWGHAVVPYRIHPDLPRKRRVRRAIRHIEEKTGVIFVRRDPQRHSDYIQFVPSEGCSSYVGRIGGRQPIHVAPWCGRAGVIHEIGHALGLWHEHSRPNRNNHIRVRWRNIRPRYRDQFYRLDSDRVRALTRYNLRSIMHYGPYAGSRNGRPTLVRRDGSTWSPSRSLTRRDIRGIKKLYCLLDWQRCD